MKKYLSMIVILSMLLTCVCSAAAVENEQDSGEPEQTLDIILFDYSSQTETAKTLTAEDSYAHQEYEKWKQSGSRTAFELTAPAYFPNSSDVDCHANMILVCFRDRVADRYTHLDISHGP